MLRKTLAALALALALTASAVSREQAVARFAAAPTLHNASVGICLRDIATKGILAANCPDMAITTASTMKTVTSSTALYLLGKDFTFTTTVQAVGRIKGHRLIGNIVITGGGDPTLGSRHFPGRPCITSLVADALEQLGITKVTGNILYQEPGYPFETFSDNWMAEDLAYDYGPGAHGLNFSDNLLTLSFSRNDSLPADFVVTPALCHLQVDCHAVTGDAQDLHRLLNLGAEPGVTLFGTVKRSDTRYSDLFTNPTPAQTLCDSLASTLALRGIALKHKRVKPRQLADTLTLLQHHSPRLSDIIHSLLLRSDNMYTECLLRAIAARATGRATAAEGIRQVHKFWQSKGIDTRPLFMRDACGLARNGKATAALLTAILSQCENDAPQLGIHLSSLMTHLGTNGNISNAIKQSPLCGQIASKSGSMSDVQCYVGYFPADKPRYTWAILVNNFLGTRAQLKNDIEQLLITLFSNDTASKEQVNESK